MYQFLDRPVTSLAPREQLLIWSMRQWVLSARAGKCPCAAIAPVYVRRKLQELIPDFNILMITLDRQSRSDLHFGQLGCPLVRDSEAMLLSLLTLAAANDTRRIEGIAGQVVKPEAQRNLVIAAGRISRMLVG